MSFRVEFTRIEGEGGVPDFCIVRTPELALDFINTRPPGYGKDFVVLNEDTGEQIELPKDTK